jgi:hypothetical protein
MPELRRLEPHDPLPEAGRYLLILRRFGEDDPRFIVTEMIVSDGQGKRHLDVPLRADGAPVTFEEAIEAALRHAERLKLELVYAVDRTAGQREHEVLDHAGDHSFTTDRLEDTDPEDNEPGTDIRDRPLLAGYNLRTLPSQPSDEKVRSQARRPRAKSDR